MIILNVKNRKITLKNKSYIIEEFINQGGSGEVYKVSKGGFEYALKVFFPYYQMRIFSATAKTKKIEESIDFQRKEYSFLSKINHPNIVRVHDYGDITLHKNEINRIQIKGITLLPAIITDYIDGKPFIKAVDSLNLKADHISYILKRLSIALKYLHLECKYMHLDLRSDNILIRKNDFEPILIDFALCKNLNFDEVNKGEHTSLLGDWDLFPKQLPTNHQLKIIKETSGKRNDIKALAFPALDFFQIGKLIYRLIPKLNGIFKKREIAYLSELSNQLTDWETVKTWDPEELNSKISRLAPEHYSPFGVAELSAPTLTERMIVIPPNIGIPITKRIEQILESRSFRRLMLVNQLCLLYFIYPAANYKRSVHMLYTYNLTRQLITHLYTSPIFRVYFQTKSIKQLLVAALLHDINHFPFLHVFQESGIKTLDELNLLDLFCNGELTGELKEDKPSIYDILDAIGIEPERFKRLVFDKHHEQKNEIDYIISSILNSGVDVDKLSYLHLDSYFTGVRYGEGIDFPTILKASTIGRLPNNGAPHLAFTDRGIPAISHVVMTRFWNFRAIYWHHTNRAIMAMLLRVVRDLYVMQKRDVKEYIIDTCWYNDIEALRYLNSKYYAQTNQTSILHGLIKDRSKLYKRLFTIQSGLDDEKEDILYKNFRKFTILDEYDFCTEFSKQLEDFISPYNNKKTIHRNEILVDIPRRDMDSGGRTYVLSFDNQLKPLIDFSEPVRAINANYERLTKKIRVFMSPRLSKILGGKIKDNRKTIRNLIADSLKAINISSEIQ